MAIFAQLTNPEPSKLQIQLDSEDAIRLVTGLNKMLSFIEDNKNLGFRDKKRLKEKERTLLIDFTEIIDDEMNKINKDE